MFQILKKGWLKIGLAVPACVSVMLGLGAPLSSFLAGVLCLQSDSCKGWVNDVSVEYLFVYLKLCAYFAGLFNTLCL